MTAEGTPFTLLRRWGRRILLFVLGLVVLIWLAPMVAAWTPLISWASARATYHLGSTVTIGGASLGWFSPIVLYNVEVRDADERVLAQIPRIEGDRSLLMLLLDHDDLGTFRLQKPNVELTFDKTGSNLEKLLEQSLQRPANALPDEGRARFPLPQIRLEVVDGTLKVHDVDLKQTYVAQSLALTAQVLGDARSVQVSVQAILHDGTEAGSLKAEMHLQNVMETNVKATIKGRFTSFPLTLLNVLVRRFEPNTVLHGSLQGHGQIDAAMQDGKPHVEISGELIGNHVYLSTPSLKERLYVERVRIPGTLRLENQKLCAEQVELHSDFGKIRLQGSLDFGADWLAALEQPDFDLAMELNLATLAERLPATMRLHPAVRLTSGRLSMQCKSQANNGAVVWQGKLHTSDVRGIRALETIAWREPIALEFQVRNLHKGVPSIDRLRCSARFLKMEGSTTADQFTLTAEADLQELAEPLKQFLDLDNLKLAGKANGTITVDRAENAGFVVQGNALFQHMNLSWLTKHPWQEESVTAKFSARGILGKTGGQRIETAEVTTNLGNDTVVLSLTEPIADLARRPSGAFAVRIEGDLTRWQNRLRSWSSALDDCQLAGQGNLQMRVRPTSQGIDCTSLHFQASNFRCTGSNWWIQEPTFEVQTVGQWVSAPNRCELTKTKVICSAIQLDAPRLLLEPATRRLSGSAEFSGDIARLRQWTRDPHLKPGELLQGRLVGRLHLHTTEERATADFNLALNNVCYGIPDHPTWREKEVKCVGRGIFHFAPQALEIEQINLTSSTLNVDAKGTIANSATTSDIDLVGMMAYDLENLEPQLRPLLGQGVKIVGKDTWPFKITGSLHPKNKANALMASITGPAPGESAWTLRELHGETRLTWKSLHALGCDIGSADVKVALQQGWLQLFPIETGFNGGKLRLQPNLRLEPGPVEMILLPGLVIDRAKITPQMCAGALGYAMPILANVADAEGSISVTLEGGRVPLGGPATGEVKGTMVLHQAKVGPNPIMRELATVLKIAAPTSLVKECKVPFHLVNGKVHHSNLELVFAGLTLKSSGAVGLDGTLAIVVEAPIPPALAAAARLTPAQARQTIRIPIGGTLEHPRADVRALESLTSVLGRSLLENQLNRLIQPK